MTIHAGTRIDLPQIGLHLDPQNTRSFVNGGNTWIDLAQGLQFTSMGTITPLVTDLNTKARYVNFNNSGYWKCSTNYNLLDLAGPFTLIMWVYTPSIPLRATIFEKAGTTYASYQQELACTLETNRSISYYSRTNASTHTLYDYGITSTSTLNKWNMFAISISNGKTVSPRTGYYSMNGQSWVTSFSSTTDSAIVAAGPITVGYGYAGVIPAARLGLLIVYHKMLSNDELKKYFNNTRGRFKV